MGLLALDHPISESQRRADRVNIPPTEPGPWVLFEGAIEVNSCNVRPSMSSALAGILDWPVCARAVVAQADGEGANFAILALDPVADQAVKISGNDGTIEAHGNIQINSESQDALAVTGQGVIEVGSVDVEEACRLVGDWPGPKGKAAVNCLAVTDALEITDRLVESGEPSKYSGVSHRTRSRGRLEWDGVARRGHSTSERWLRR
jgi:hypothetical protein